MAAIFLSHSSRNDVLASALEAWLKANGFDDLFVDHDSIRAGDKWAEELRRAKGACRVVLCLVTQQWLESDECYGEFKACWYLGRRIIPLLVLADATLTNRQHDRLARVISEDQGIELGAAGDPDLFDLARRPEIAESLRNGLLAAGALAKVGLDPGVFEVDPRAKPEPFPGLESFDDTDADAAIFFGRSPEIAQCLEDLREMRATGDRRAYALQGASGSGKSSLLKAGILPRLRRERGWFVLRAFRPGADPLYNFADAIARTANGLGVHLTPGAVRDRLLADRAAGADLRATLEEIVAPLKRQADRVDATVLIAMDQGEELARATGDSAETLSAYLRAAVQQPREGQLDPWVLTLTVRSDSFPDLQQSRHFEGLAVRAADLRTLPVFRFAAAIEQPAARYGVEIETALIDVLMEDASGKDALPLLAFTLQRLWRQYAAEGRIRKVDYNSIGKLSGIIADAAERALRNIDPLAPQGPLEGKVSEARDRHAARVFVPGFAQVNDDGNAVRRVANLSSFDEDDLALIGSFAKWRLVVIASEVAEVAHEAMFREWPRFREWLEPEKARLAALRAVEGAAADWEAKGRRPEDLIHRGKRLAEARALEQVKEYKTQIDANPHVGAYLAACAAYQRRGRLTSAGVAAGILAVFVAYGGYLQLTRTREQNLGAVEMAHQQALAATRQARTRAVAAAATYQPAAPVLAQPSAARDLPKGASFRDCPDCPEMVVVPAGAFSMGAPASDTDRGGDETPQHQVAVPKLAVGKFDVTFDEWAACVAGGGCKANPTPEDYGGGRSRRPVVDLSWNDAQDYVRWLSARTGARYRLPSEAEWEYAARAGGTTRFWSGATIDETQANFNDTVHNTEPVGSHAPNAFGLYDMAGNAWQWTQDCYHDFYTGAPTTGAAWVAGDCSNRVIRGGSWYDAPAKLRVTNREGHGPSERLAHTGMRVAREL